MVDMKAKKRRAYLQNKIKWWDSQSKVYQTSTTRPGSVKTR